MHCQILVRNCLVQQMVKVYIINEFGIFFPEKLVKTAYKNFVMKAGFISYKMQELSQICLWDIVL